jgi:hypothetical protein
MSMCLYRLWATRSLISDRTPLLSIRRGLAVVDFVPSDARSSRNQTTSHVAIDAAINSASVVDRATAVCLLLLQEIALPNRKTMPVVDLLVLVSPAQPASTYPSRFLFPLAYNYILIPDHSPGEAAKDPLDRSPVTHPGVRTRPTEIVDCEGLIRPRAKGEPHQGPQPRKGTLR